MASKAEKALMAQQTQLYNLMMQQINKTNAPDPNIERLRGVYNTTLDWYDPKNVKDIYKHPTIAAQINPLQVALSDREDKRVGTGILGAKMNSASSPYAADLALDRSFKRKLAGAGMLSGALSGEYDKAMGGLTQITGVDINRQQGGNSLMGAFNSALNSSLQRESEKGNWWKNLLGGLASGVSGTIKGVTI